MTEFGHLVEDYLSVGKGADATGRNSKSAYRKHPGELAGCINVALWHAIGHTVRHFLFVIQESGDELFYKATESIFSKDQLQTSAAYSACAKLVDQLRDLSYKLNETLRLLDPDAYNAHRELREKLKAMYAHVRARSAIDPFLFQGRSIIYNRQTPNHRDKREPKIGWTPLFVAGNFTGGWLRIRRLGLRMWYGPGACIFLRGGLLPHEVEPFDGGQRICVASFLHQSVRDDAGIQPVSTGIKSTDPPKRPTIGIPGLSSTPKPSTESSTPDNMSEEQPRFGRGLRARKATTRFGA